jgi:thiol-disulfide isomerase/thioredoxin
VYSVAKFVLFPPEQTIVEKSNQILPLRDPPSEELTIFLNLFKIGQKSNSYFFQRRSRRAFCLLYLFMMYRLFICWVWIGAVVSLRAGAVDLDSMTVGSTTYSNVTVFGANATDLFFASDQGMSNVKLKFLNPELQQRFNYNSNAAAKIEQQQIADEKEYQENLAAAIATKAKTALQDRETEIQATYSEAGLADPVSEASPIGKQAPDLDFTNWSGVKPNLTGKFALISVWSPKSASCRKWIPTLNELHKTLAGKVEVVGVTTATEAEISQSDPKTDFPSGIDPEGKFLTEAGITMLPCVLLVDTNNVVRYLGHPAAVTTNTLQGLFKNTGE